MFEREWELRITLRCLADDLGAGINATPRAEAHAGIPIVQAFVQRRGQRPEGQETFRCATRALGRTIYTLHAGDDRGATWYQLAVDEASDTDLGVVWLLGAKPSHDYDTLCALRRRLLPESVDIQAVIAERARTLTRALVEEVPQLVAEARASRGRIVESVVAGRIPVRLFCDPNESAPLLTVAISSRLLPGSGAWDRAWLPRLLSAFFPNAGESLSMTIDVGGGPLRSDEAGFCDFI